MITNLVLAASMFHGIFCHIGSPDFPFDFVSPSIKFKVIPVIDKRIIVIGCKRGACMRSKKSRQDSC